MSCHLKKCQIIVPLATQLTSLMVVNKKTNTTHFLNLRDQLHT